MKRRRILFLLEGRDTPSSRLRVLNYLPYLNRECYEWEAWPIPNSVFSRPSLFAAAARADLVFVQKKLFRPWELPFLGGLRPMIYDFDDMVMLPGRDRYDPGRAETGPRGRRFKRTLARARVIVAGSGYLRTLTGAAMDRTVVIPTPVATEAQPVKEVCETSKELVLGWIGTKGNLRYLEALTGVLRRLADRHAITLKIVCDDFIEPEGVPTIKKPWRLEDEAADLIGFDIGLMPLTDDPWARGKCGFKLLQYMAAGLPTVASPVGVNTEIVQDGVNGFLALTEGEWEDRLDRLLNSAALRREMGAAGRRTVENGYDLRRRAEDFSRVLDMALGLAQGGGSR